jgi:hypothetical protein
MSFSVENRFLGLDDFSVSEQEFYSGIWLISDGAGGYVMINQWNAIFLRKGKNR